MTGPGPGAVRRPTPSSVPVVAVAADPQPYTPIEPTWFERVGAGRPWLAPTAVGVFVGLATAYTAWQDPNGDGVFPQCPTRTVFGVDCPGCGGLRATHALVHGHVSQAFDHNVLVAVLLPVAVVLWAIWLVRALRSTWEARRERAAGDPEARPRKVRFPVTFPGGSSPAWRVLIVGLIAFTVVRNITAVPLFEYLHSDV